MSSKNQIPLCIPKLDIKDLGGEAAILYAYIKSIINTKDYNQKIDSWIPLSIDVIENELGFSYKIQQKCISILKSKKLIGTKRMGIPAKRYITLK